MCTLLVPLEIQMQQQEEEDANFSTSHTVLASSYGWGPIPMLNLYDIATELPVLPWNRSVSNSLAAKY